MAIAHTETTVEDEFTELDELEVIESSELKIGGPYHSYTYIAADNEEDILH
jgi:hypothetical protein